MLSSCLRRVAPPRACARRAWRAYSTSPLPPLPPTDTWKHLFPLNIHTRDRFTVCKPETAALLANAFIPAGSKDKVVVEMFPGPGSLTRALLELPRTRIRKLIVLEDNEGYLEYLRPLEQDPRVTILPHSAIWWDTYSLLQSNGHLADDLKVPWGSGVHPHLHCVGHIPRTTIGEQFVSQLMRCIPEGSWLYQYGRMPMSLVLSEWLWQRMRAPLEHKNRCKLTIIADATAEHADAVPATALQPYEDHIHPMPSLGMLNSAKRIDVRKVGAPVVAVNITPLAHPHIGKGMGDKWDYVVRRLFVKKATSLENCIGNLAPGAEDLLRRMTDPSLPEGERIDAKKKIRDFTIEEWAVICKAFDEWPFAPEDLMITDAFNREDDNNNIMR